MPAPRGARWRAPGVPGFAGNTGSSTEAVSVTGAAQALARGGSPRGILARVMNQRDRQIELPLQRAKVCQ